MDFHNVAYGVVQSGEVSGSVTAKQLPDIPCRWAMFIAEASNAAAVYLGGAGVTVRDGTTDATSGWQLAAGGKTILIPISNINKFYIIGTNATDDIIYLAIG